MYSFLFILQFIITSFLPIENFRLQLLKENSNNVEYAKKRYKIYLYGGKCPYAVLWEQPEVKGHLYLYVEVVDNFGIEAGDEISGDFTKYGVHECDNITKGIKVKLFLHKISSEFSGLSKQFLEDCPTNYGLKKHFETSKNK